MSRQKPNQCMLQESSNTLQQVGRRNKIGTRIGKATAVLCDLYRSVVTQRELSNTTMLAVLNSIFVPILTYMRCFESLCGCCPRDSPQRKRGCENE